MNVHFFFLIVLTNTFHIAEDTKKITLSTQNTDFSYFESIFWLLQKCLDEPMLPNGIFGHKKNKKKKQNWKKTKISWNQMTLYRLASKHFLLIKTNISLTWYSSKFNSVSMHKLNQTYRNCMNQNRCTTKQKKSFDSIHFKRRVDKEMSAIHWSSEAQLDSVFYLNSFQKLFSQYLSKA